MRFPLVPPPATPARVVVTGAGIVTALGLDWKANAAGFRVGTAAFRPVQHFDVSRQRVKTAAEVDLPEALPATRLSPREAKRLDHAGRMLLWAAQQAWQQCRWEEDQNIPLVLGTTSGGMSMGEAYYRQIVEQPKRRREQPSRVLQYQAQFQAAQVGRALGCAGPITIISNACASGANAIGHAWWLVRRGLAKRVLAGGYDAVSQLVFAGFDSLLSLTPTRCRPFDSKRDGLALGEGAAVFALEALDSAQARRAKILGEVAGYGAATDAHHLTQPHPQGDAALESMSRACAAAGLKPEHIDYINAHGTGTLLNDSAEAKAINQWAGPYASSLPVSSTKADIGHLLGAAGAVEAAICLMALQEGWLPPTSTLENTDALCRFPVVRKPTESRLTHALSNSFGFGGANATLILRRWSAA